MYRKTNNPVAEEILKSHKERSCDLSYLKAIKIDGIRFCAWCTEGKLTHGNQKYCSDDCSLSALASFYPQKEEGLNLLLIRQDWKCGICQYDWAPLGIKIAEAYHGGHSYNLMVDIKTETNWYIMKRLKSECEKSRKPEVDHIVPICRGGQSLGLENHQAVCFACHKTKTKVDLSGKRSK